MTAADRISLAAAPTFSLMAGLIALLGNDHAALHSSQVGGPSALGGMVPMYLLMAAFHLTPWLRLATNRGPGQY